MTAQPDWQAIGQAADRNIDEQYVPEPPHVAKGRDVPSSKPIIAAVAVPGPGPGPGPREEKEPPAMRTLRAMHDRGELEPDPGVELGPMPDTATDRMREAADEIRLRLGLRLADGVRDCLPFATSELVNAGICKTKPNASWVLGRLCDAQVILYAGSLPKRGKGDGTKTYIPPGWTDLLPPDELTERRRREAE